MLDDDISCRLDVAAGVDAADDMDRAVHLQFTGDSGDILAHHQHVGDQNAPAAELKFSVHFRYVGHAVRLDGEADAAQRFFLGSVFGMNGFTVDVRSHRALLGRVVEHNPLALIDHLKGFDIDIVHTSIWQGGRDTRQVEAHEKFKPSILSAVCRDTLRDQHLFVHTPFVNQIFDCVVSYAIDDSAPF